MKIFFSFNSKKLNEENALLGDVWQFLELFYKLPNDNQSFVGVKDKYNFTLEIKRINLFLWEWTVFNPTKNEYEFNYFSFPKSERLIHLLFQNSKINGILNPEIKKN